MSAARWTWDHLPTRGHPRTNRTHTSLCGRTLMPDVRTSESRTANDSGPLGVSELLLDVYPMRISWPGDDGLGRVYASHREDPLTRAAGNSVADLPSKAIDESTLAEESTSRSLGVEIGVRAIDHPGESTRARQSPSAPVGGTDPPVVVHPETPSAVSAVTLANSPLPTGLSMGSYPVAPAASCSSERPHMPTDDCSSVMLNVAEAVPLILRPRLEPRGCA